MFRTRGYSLCLLGLTLVSVALLSERSLAAEAAPPPAPSAIAERVLDLPEDGEAWYTTLLVHPPISRDIHDQRLLEAFDTEDRLRSLKTQTRFHVYANDHPIYQQRFAPHVQRLPAVFVQRGASGEVVFSASGPEVAEHPHRLGHAIQQAICRRCPHGRCQPVLPQPTPPPDTPVLPPGPEPVPNLGPPPAPDPGPTTAPFWQIVCVACVAFGGTWLASFKHDLTG